MKTSGEWLYYYRKNFDAPSTIPWELGAELTAEEVAAIGHSVQEFQLGESSEGRHLIQDACAYGVKAGDPFYPETIRYFIAEEQRHALELGRFLELHGVPLVRTTPADRIFRWGRNLFPGLELSIAVLVIGELIAQVYYKALRDATGSVILRRICDQILHDEVSHVAFQSEQLARLRASRGRFAYALTMGWQRLMFLAAVTVIGISHRSVLRRASMSGSGWRSACRQRFQAAFSTRLREEAQREARTSAGSEARSAMAATM